jgi:Lsr2
MAIKITGAVLADDEDPHADVETVTFGYRGQIYQVELTAQERATLRSVFERFLADAQPLGECPGPPPT